MSHQALPEIGKKIKVGMIQINTGKAHDTYLPYSLGCIQAYAQKYCRNIEQFEFLSPICRRIPVDAAVESLLDCSIAFFSTYVWNIRISLEIARSLKERNPHIITVFGGPQVPDRADIFLAKNRFIDLLCHGEGEQVFTTILENFTTGSWEGVPSISYRDEKEQYIQNNRGVRLSDLNTVPSPFLMGIFDRLLQSNSPQIQWLGLWETNRGCPYACTFCDWGSAIAQKVYRFDMERLVKEVEWFSKNKIEFVFCCDANFGIFDRDIELASYLAESKKKYGYPKTFNVNSAKNSPDKTYRINKILADAGLHWGVTLSMQSVDQGTLKNIKRANIKTSVYQDLQQRYLEEGTGTYTEIILGLPGESYESYTKGIAMLVENGQHCRIMFYNAGILPNAEMADPEYRKIHGIMTQEIPMIISHRNLDENDQILEKEEIIIETATLSREDWVRAKIFSFMISLIYYNKLLQVPLLLIHKIYSIPIHELFELFSSGNIDRTQFPILFRIHEFFHKKAISIQRGDEEYCASKKWLNIWWTADEMMLIQLCTENSLDSFYQESEKLIWRFLDEKKVGYSKEIIGQSILLGRALFKKPFQKENMNLKLSYNLWEVYQAALRGKFAPVLEGDYLYEIQRENKFWLSWEEWCKEVVWFGGHKTGQFFYPCALTNDFNEAKHAAV